MPPTLKQHAYKLIRRRLLSGSIPPGARLSDDALAKELGISRSPIREAISQLTSEGLVEHRPRSGAYVRLPEPRELEEWYETRCALEGLAAMRAAERITPTQLGELDRLLQEILGVVEACRTMPGQKSDARLIERFLSLDLAFHTQILRAADNHWVLKLVEDCKLMTTVFGHVHIEHNLQLLSRSYQGHVRIVRAIKRRQPEQARRAMEEHIQFAQRTVLAGYAARRSALLGALQSPS